MNILVKSLFHQQVSQMVENDKCFLIDDIYHFLLDGAIYTLKWYRWHNAEPEIVKWIAHYNNDEAIQEFVDYLMNLQIEIEERDDDDESDKQVFEIVDIPKPTITTNWR